MKRPPQLWIVSIGILCAWLLPNAIGLRATSLIFAKTTTSTSSTTDVSASPVAEEGTSTSPQSDVTPSSDNQSSTRPPLTGNPQIDYIWDPNLPFELKNYNLSDYPFYDRLPEDIDFKCDGLHDGFYASVPHKCQVYHHCLFGTRYDFLCANFTAFDQKTFICHFVSEVDCNNSKKFWHRNDALYQAASTTAASTTPAQQPVTPNPALNPALRRPVPLGGVGGGGVLAGRRRRPFRRRPIDYYYDEEYEDDRDRDRFRGRNRGRDRDEDDYDDLPRGRRRRPRPRRPEYDEYEYDDYEDVRYDRRPGRREEDRRPYRDDDRRYDDRRPASKSKDRRVEEDEDDLRPSSKNKDRRIEEEEDDLRPSIKNKNTRIEDDEEDRRPSDRRKTVDRRRPIDDDDDYDRRPYDRPRKSSRDRYDDDKDDDRRPYDRPRKTIDSAEDDRRPYDRPRRPGKLDEDDRRSRPNKDQKSQSSDEKDDRRMYDRPRKSQDEDRRYRPTSRDKEARPTEESKVLIKPSSGSSVYDRPRAPPIIRRPVPLNERDKFDYKPPTSGAKPSAKPLSEEEEYYDDYEEDPKPPPKPTTRKPISESSSEERRNNFNSRRAQGGFNRRPSDDEEERRPAKRPPNSRSQERTRYEDRNNKKLPVDEEYADEYEEDKTSLKGESSREQEKSSERGKFKPEPTTTTTTSTTTEENVSSRERPRRPEPIVKIVKRPFLPSRGGDPYSSRGLQPVGAKALDATTENIKVESTSEKSQESAERNKSEEEYYDEVEEVKPITKRPFRTEPRTTQKPKVLGDNYRNPLDINENEYDVTLNDALNPTLPNLPVRSVPTGFSSGREGYLQNYQRPRLVAVETPVLTPSNSDFVYVKQPTARYNPYIAVQLNRQPYTTYQ